MAVQEVKPQPSTAGRPRTLSEISFPYFDLEDSIAVAEKVLNRGGGSCAPDQLAAWLGYDSINSGTYKTRVSAARQFGLIETIAGRISITERAKTIMAPVLEDDATKAKADAFLNVELFRAVYERFRGGSIPQEAGMRNLFEHTFKVIPGRITQAYKMFLASAEQAGFFRESKSKLIRPAAPSASETPPAPEMPPEAENPAETRPTAIEKPRWRDGGGGGDGSGGGIHTALIGLLRELPKPGESWTAREQEDFIAAFTGLIKFIFPARKPDGTLDALLK